MIMCPDCRSSISDREPFCTVCGRRMEAARPIRRPPPPGEAETEFGTYVRPGIEPLGPVAVRRAPADWRGRMGCLVVLLVFAIIVAAGSYVAKLQRGHYSPTEADAYEIGVMHIKDTIKARTIVRFPSVSQVETTKLDADTYAFRSNYGIKGASGAQETKPFRVVVRYVGKGENYFDSWTVLDAKY